MDGTRDHFKLNEPNLERLITCFLTIQHLNFEYTLKVKGDKLRNEGRGDKDKRR